MLSPCHPDWDESNRLGVESDFLDVVGHFRLDFSESLLTVWWLSGVHLVNSNDELLNSKGVGQESVFSGLTILGDTGFKFTDTSSNNKYGTISLRCTSNHVLDEISMTGSINNGDREVFGLELPEGDIDGDTSFTFGLELVQNPSVFKGTFTHLLGFLLELFDSSLVDSSALID